LLKSLSKGAVTEVISRLKLLSLETIADEIVEEAVADETVTERSYC